ALQCDRREIGDETAAEPGAPRPFLDEDVLDIEAGAALPGRVVREEEGEAGGAAIDKGEAHLEAPIGPEPVAQQIRLARLHRIGLALEGGERLDEGEDGRHVGGGRVANLDLRHAAAPGKGTRGSTSFPAARAAIAYRRARGRRRPSTARSPGCRPWHAP